MWQVWNGHTKTEVPGTVWWRSSNSLDSWYSVNIQYTKWYYRTYIRKITSVSDMYLKTYWKRRQNRSSNPVSKNHVIKGCGNKVACILNNGTSDWSDSCSGRLGPVGSHINILFEQLKHQYFEFYFPRERSMYCLCNDFRSKKWGISKARRWYKRLNDSFRSSSSSSSSSSSVSPPPSSYPSSLKHVTVRNVLTCTVAHSGLEGKNDSVCLTVFLYDCWVAISKSFPQ